MEGTHWVCFVLRVNGRLSFRTVLDEKKEKKPKETKEPKKEDNVNALDRDWKCGSGMHMLPINA